MIYVNHGVNLLVTPPAEHHYTYTEGRSGTTKQQLSPLFAGGKVEATSGYIGYMRGFEPLQNDYIYSALSFSVSGGTTHSVTQAAETTSQGRTVYYRYINGTRNTGSASYDEPGELSYTITQWRLAAPENDITATVQVTWKYKQSNGQYNTTTNNMGKSDVLMRQGDRTQTDYTFSIAENQS